MPGMEGGCVTKAGHAKYEGSLHFYVCAARILCYEKQHATKPNWVYRGSNIFRFGVNADHCTTHLGLGPDIIV